MIVSGDIALQNAARQIGSTPVRDDPLFAPWSRATLGEPVLVATVHGEPSYWLVPAIIRDRVVGFVRVLGSGRVAAVGTFYQHPDLIQGCPTVVTGISAQQAAERAMCRISQEQGEAAQDPIFVHDGPPGREAWLVEVRKAGKPERWIFVTGAFVYERPAGELLDETLE